MGAVQFRRLLVLVQSRSDLGDNCLIWVNCTENTVALVKTDLTLSNFLGPGARIPDNMQMDKLNRLKRAFKPFST